MERPFLFGFGALTGAATPSLASNFVAAIPAYRAAPVRAMLTE
jgi:hypothetical protein